jgi:predicted histone-like DNA-binding protein
MRFRLPVVLPQQRIRAGGSSSLFRFFCLHRRNENLVIESLISDITSGLKAGKAVFLDKLGKFRLSFSSKGVATAKEFTTDLIKGIRIVFTPCKELKLTKKELSFELAPTRKEQAAAVKKIKNGTEVVVPKDPEKPATGGDTTGGGSGVGA